MNPIEKVGKPEEPGFIDAIVEAFKAPTPTFWVELPGVGKIEFKAFEDRDEFQEAKSGATVFAKGSAGKKWPKGYEHMTVLYAQGHGTLEYAWLLGRQCVGSVKYRFEYKVVDGAQVTETIELDGGKLGENEFLKLAKQALMAFEFVFAEFQANQTNIKNFLEAARLEAAKNA